MSPNAFSDNLLSISHMTKAAKEEQLLLDTEEELFNLDGKIQRLEGDNYRLEVQVFDLEFRLKAEKERAEALEAQLAEEKTNSQQLKEMVAGFMGQVSILVNALLSSANRD